MEKNKQKYKDSDYLDAVLFEDRDVDIRAQTKRIVTTRVQHRCAFADSLGKDHLIRAGSRAVLESAVVEGKWGTCYSCLPCIDKWLDHLEDLEHGKE